MNTIKDYTIRGYDWLMSKLAKRLITGAYTDGQNTALRIALDNFHRARREDLYAIKHDIETCGEGIDFKDADPNTAYKLGKQIAIDAVISRARGVS